MCAAANSLRILVLGDPATGKTTYCHRLSNSSHPGPPKRKAKDFDTVSIKVKLDDQTEVPINLVKIAGTQLGNEKICKQFQNVDGIIIMCDVTEFVTFVNVTNWREEFNSVQPAEIPSMFLANKCDLEKNEEVAVSLGHVAEYCEAYQFVAGFEISSVTGENAEKSMKEFVEKVLNHRKKAKLDLAPMRSNLERTSETTEKQDLLLKIIVIGDTYTGKTAFVERYVRNRFDPLYKVTIGVDSQMKKIKYRESTVLSLQFWDIQGEERARNMTSVFYRDADGCLLAFDVSKPATLTTGVVKWKQDLDAKLMTADGRPIPCLLIGNKCDLNKEGDIGDATFMENFVKKYGLIGWFEASAKTNANVSKSIMCLIDEIMKNRDQVTRVTSGGLSLDDGKSQNSKRRRKCCK